MSFNPTLAKLRAIQTNAFNLEAMLALALRGKNSQIILEQITSAVSYHFSLEEKTMENLKIKISEEHLSEHKKLLEEIKRQEENWRKKIITDELFAESIKVKLFFHIRSQDNPLRDSILQTTNS